MPRLPARTLTPAQLAWLSRRIGSGAPGPAAERLAGGASSTVLALRDAAGASRFVLRLFDDRAWLAAEPDLVAHELAALAEAARTGLPVPEVVAAEPTGEVFGAPAILTTYLPGRVVLAPGRPERWTELLAATLARIHAHRAPGFPWRYRSWVGEGALSVPAWTAHHAAWAEAVLRARGLHDAPGTSEPRRWAFLHRDYHPLNLLFAGAGPKLRLTGVVDWVNACVGPPEVDLSHCRLNLVLTHGVAAADAFLAAYLRRARVADPGFGYSRAWDLEAVFAMAAPDPAYHAPWADFGLPDPGAGELRRRVDELVAGAVAAG